MALRNYRNTETGEIVALDETWGDRWPDDPFEPYDGEAQPGEIVEAPAPAEQPPAPTQKSGTPTQQPEGSGDRGRF